MEIKVNFNNQNTFEKKCSLLHAAVTNICAFKWVQQNLSRMLPSPGIILEEAIRRESFVLVLEEATTLAEVTIIILENTVAFLWHWQLNQVSRLPSSSSSLRLPTLCIGDGRKGI